MEQNKLGNFYILVISNSHSVIPKILKVVGPLGKRSCFSVPWDLKYQRVTIVRPEN